MPTNSQPYVIHCGIMPLRTKFQGYVPEPASMLFHYCLLRRDKIALYSFIHLLSTNFGTSIFEFVVGSLALLRHADLLLRQVGIVQIFSEFHLVIQSIINLSTMNITLTGLKELVPIRIVSQRSEPRSVKPPKVDLKLLFHDRTIYQTDINPALPNVRVASKFWAFLGDERRYSNLLDCSETASLELRPEIDAYFSRFNK
jgi:type II restriction enzyme